MPFKRKLRFRNKRGRIVRGAKYRNSLSNKAILRKMNKYNVHDFIRWNNQSDTEQPVIDCNFGTSGTSPVGLSFRLNQVINYTELVALYDQFMIKGVRVYFDYSPDVVGSIPYNASNTVMPKLWIKRDYDDSATPTITEMTQSNQSKCLRFTANRTTRSLFLRPAVANRVYNSTTADGFTSIWKPWINCDNNNTPFYGLKLLAQGLPSTNMGAITIRIKYYLRFKNVR